MPTRIETPAQLKRLWDYLQRRFDADPALAGGFIDAPFETIRALGFRLGPGARDALLAALP